MSWAHQSYTLDRRDFWMIRSFGVSCRQWWGSEKKLKCFKFNSKGKLFQSVIFTYLHPISKYSVWFTFRNGNSVTGDCLCDKRDGQIIAFECEVSSVSDSIAHREHQIFGVNRSNPQFQSLQWNRFRWIQFVLQRHRGFIQRIAARHRFEESCIICFRFDWKRFAGRVDIIVQLIHQNLGIQCSRVDFDFHFCLKRKMPFLTHTSCICSGGPYLWNFFECEFRIDASQIGSVAF